MPARSTKPGSKPTKKAAAAPSSASSARPAAAVVEPVAGEDQVLGRIVKDLQKSYGSGAVQRLSEEVYEEFEWVVPTGIAKLDQQVFGTGGLPLGALVVITGVESSGKSTLCKVIEAAATERGARRIRNLRGATRPLGERRVVYPYVQDVERSGVLARDQALGINLERALGSPDQALDTLERCFELQEGTLTTIRKHGGLGLGILDSVTAPMMAAEAKLDYDDEARRGLRAAFLARNLKKLMDAVLAGGTNTLLFTNQVRENMDASTPWAKKTKDAGGYALRFYAHIKIEMIPMGKLRQGKDGPIIGVTALARCVKNKLAPPFGEAKLNIYFDPPRVESADEPVRQIPQL